MRLTYEDHDIQKAETLPNGCRVARLVGHGGKLEAKFFLPKAKKPVEHYAFKDEAAREARIAQLGANYDAHVERVTAERAARKPSAGILEMANPGAIFSYSWGYDQTNIDYFQVVKRAGSVVTVSPVGVEVIDGGGPSADIVRPKKNSFAMHCGAPKIKWDGKMGVCGNGKNAGCHDEHRAEAFSGAGSYHEYVPKMVTELKKVYPSTDRKGRPAPGLSFSHGCGTLVEQITFADGTDALVVGTEHRTAFGWGH